MWVFNWDLKKKIYLSTPVNCDCTKIHPVDEDDDELELSFSRATDDICWVNTTRLGVPTKCTSADLVTVAVSEDDIMASYLMKLPRAHDYHNAIIYSS